MAAEAENGEDDGVPLWPYQPWGSDGDCSEGCSAVRMGHAVMGAAAGQWQVCSVR